MRWRSCYPHPAEKGNKTPCKSSDGLGVLYATSGYRLMDPELNPQTVRFFLLRGLTIPVVFLLTIGISFFSVSIAIYYWLLLVVVDSGCWFEPSIAHSEQAAAAKRRTPERSRDFLQQPCSFVPGDDWAR